MVYSTYMVELVKCVDTWMTKPFHDQKSPPLTWVSKTLNYALMNWPYWVHSLFFSAYMQNFKNCSKFYNNIPYDSPWVDYSLSILATKIDVLMGSLYLIFFSHDCQNFASPPHFFLLLVSPFLAIYRLSFLFSKWMKECNQKYQNLVFFPKTYIHISPLEYISTP